MQTDNLLYNKNLQPRANSLRKSMTKAEACLWKYVLKAGKMEGYQFRRQRPVLHYIADFMCKDLKLIVEVDGVTHNDEGVNVNDVARQKLLEENGFRVIRFRDEDVLRNIEGVRMELVEVVKAMSTPLIPRQRGREENRK